MYQTLIDQPPGPVVHSRWAPPLRTCLRIFNCALAAASTGLLVVTLYLAFHPLRRPDPAAAGSYSGFGSPNGFFGRPTALHAWSLWLSGGLATLGLVAALTGLKSLRVEQRRSLASYTFLLSCLIAAQVALLVLIFLYTGWQKDLPRTWREMGWRSVGICLAHQTHCWLLCASKFGARQCPGLLGA